MHLEGWIRTFVGDRADQAPGRQHRRDSRDIDSLGQVLRAGVAHGTWAVDDIELTACFLVRGGGRAIQRLRTDSPQADAAISKWILAIFESVLENPPATR